jgi:hypothetical protein
MIQTTNSKEAVKTEVVEIKRRRWFDSIKGQITLPE